MPLKGNNVRLTEQAHQLLAEKAEDYNVSMKDVASEAIVLLTKRDNMEKECSALLEKAERKEKDNLRRSFGTFILGALASGCVVYFSVVIW